MGIETPLAGTPPMGWNSWDCYGGSVTEDEVLANARFMADRLKKHGWDTVVVDIQWYEPTAHAGGYNDNAPVELDAYGRPVPAVNRFPSAAGGAGFGPLARQVHELGLRFGVHIMRGIPRLAVKRDLPILASAGWSDSAGSIGGTNHRASEVADREAVCVWNGDNFGLNHDHPGAQAYYDSLLRLFAEWGVDFVKADDMLRPYHAREIAAFATAVGRSGRDIVLSLSPGPPSLERAEHLRGKAQMWRVSDDLWDRWSDVYDQFERMSRWAPVSGPGSWPDADMLPLGRIGIRAHNGPDRQSLLTPDEQRTLMSLWCISRSPLMFGGDLPSTDPDTLALITNDAVLGLLKHSTGNRQVLREGDLVVWAADAEAGTARYVAAFATGEQPLRLDLPLSTVGCPDGVPAVDLWTGADLGTVDHAISGTIPPHGSLLLRLGG